LPGRATLTGSVDPLLTASALELARRIRTGETSSLEIVERHIARIEEVNAHLDALVCDRFDAARQEAKDADARRAHTPAAELPPLHGVPCSIKESIALAGMPHTSGVVARAGIVAERDATPVARLRAAGAIPLGVTNTSELTAFAGAYNKIYGRTRNAYRRDRSPGGSSGGEGALVGAGASPFGLGTDIGGSIRVPAFCNGVFGHKPTGGLVPGSSQWPSYTGALLRMNTTGPLARSAEDLMPLLRIVAGPDGIDTGCEPMALGDPDAVDLQKLRVLVPYEEVRFGRVAPELAAARHDAGYALARRGARVESCSIPALRDASDLFAGVMVEAGGLDFDQLVAPGESLHLGRELARLPFGRSPHTTPVLLLALVLRLARLAPGRFRRHAERARALAADLEQLLGDDAVLLVPPARRVAPPLEADVRAATNFVYTGLFNALGLPATQVPLGLGRERLPLGVQVVAARGRDHLTIAVARALEAARGGWVPAEPAGA
jgi:fatty acid amide hydrolase 2